MDDSTLGSRDSKGEIHATSVICAPVRQGKTVLGLVHLYATDTERVPDPEDLEYTLAVADTVAVALTNLYRRQELSENLTQARDENVQLREQLGVQSEIVGVSSWVGQITEEIARAAASRATLLIRGESGVGKELVARAVHYSSPRKKNVFVCLNYAALSEDLLASELFGHEKGAFTNATQTSKGVFELANGGTLFLDEIGELPLGMQPKLLRALETHRIKRVGGSREIPIDIRLVSATNKNLGEAVGSGEFREDLFYRVNVIPLDVPPIRERVEDIRPLVEFITEDMSRMTGLPPLRFSPDALLKMETYSWPGNVREMRNLVERLVILHGNRERPPLIGLSQLPEEIRGGRKANSGSAESGQVVTLEELERRHILLMMERFQGNKSEVSRQLGISRNTLKDKLNKYGLSR
jgi:Nif-specific regulatory protein